MFLRVLDRPLYITPVRQLTPGQIHDIVLVTTSCTIVYTITSSLSVSDKLAFLTPTLSITDGFLFYGLIELFRGHRSFPL